MKKNIQLLDCTLRDGAYIVNADFGTPAIKGIIKKMQDANIDIIECGWLKNAPHRNGTSFFHVPDDLKKYLLEKNPDSLYTVMIDWDRYDLDSLPDYDGRTIDAIRVVFPKEKFREGIALGTVIREKGYQVLFQAANTLGYSEEDLRCLAKEINHAKPLALSIVDTFGAMYWEDLSRIISVLDAELDRDIKLGFHSHNNQQLSFSLTTQFVEKLYGGERSLIVDSSLCGMGRGAGNTTTELIASYLDRKYKCNYDMNVILDAIDMYMGYFSANYSWGYSTPYFIAGLYCTHVNNIAYLLENHRTNAKDMRNIIESLSVEDRHKYNYDLLEKKYIEYQNKGIDDEAQVAYLCQMLQGREVLLLAPGSSISRDKEQIKKYIAEYHPAVIGINAVCGDYQCDYLFFSNKTRYQYAKEIYPDAFDSTDKIIVSNVKTKADKKDIIINFNLLIKRGWEHFDNAVILCLRLMNKLHVKEISIAGFDGFSSDYAQNYSDSSLPNLNPENRWDELNVEIKDMFEDFKATTQDRISIKFITESIFR